MRRIYREKTFNCGDYKEIYVYPLYAETQKPGKRKPKAKPTSEAQKKLNKRISENKLIRLLNANFTADDLSFDLTYTTENHPCDEKQARRDLQNFLRRLKRYRQNAGLPPLKYIAVTEIGKKKKRYHHHLVISGGVKIQELAKMWGLGFTKAQPLQFNETGLIGKGKYMLKQSLYSRSFCASRNLVHPQPTTRDGRISHKRAMELCQALDDREQYEKLYEGYTFAEASGFYNDQNDGCYTCIRMYRKNADFNGTIRRRKTPPLAMREISPQQND